MIAKGSEGEILCGLNTVLAALQQRPEQIDAVWLSAKRGDRRSTLLIEAARQAHVRLRRVPRAKLEQLVGGSHHQGVVARLTSVATRDEGDIEPFLAELASVPLLLVLDGVQDPRNLGACLRSADGGGAQAVIIPRDRCASMTATVRQVASGAAESMAIFQVGNLKRVLERLREAGIWLVGAAHDAPHSLFDVDLRGPTAVIIGGEEKGLRRLTRECCDELVHIPMLGAVPSLNVSVAAAVCLYECVRQRRAMAARAAPIAGADAVR